MRPCYSPEKEPVKGKAAEGRQRAAKRGLAARPHQRPGPDGAVAEGADERRIPAEERSGGDAGAEVSGGSRWRARLRALGGKSEMGKDLANDAGLLDRRDQPHAPPTARTSEPIEVERMSHEVRPRPIARCVGSLGLELGAAPRRTTPRSPTVWITR